MAQGFFSLNYGDQVVTLNSEFVSGLQGFSISTDTNETPIKVLGYGMLDVKKNSPISHTLNLEAIFHSGNQFMHYLTGSSGNVCLTGLIYQRDKYYLMESGYCDSVSLSVQPGDVIKTSCTIKFYGNFVSGSGLYTGDHESTGTIYIPSYGSIDVILNNNFSGNCVKSFDYTASLQKEPLFGIGNINPLFIQPVLPTKHEIDITMDMMGDVDLVQFGQTLCNEYKEDIFLSIKTKCDFNVIFEHNFAACSLQTQAMNTSITKSRPNLTLRYLSYDWGHAAYEPDEYQCRTRITGYLPVRTPSYDPPQVQSSYQILGYIERPSLP